MKLIIPNSYFSPLETDFIKGKILPKRISRTDGFKLLRISPLHLAVSVLMMFAGILIVGGGVNIGLVFILFGALAIAFEISTGARRLGILSHYQTLYLLDLLIFSNEERETE